MILPPFEIYSQVFINSIQNHSKLFYVAYTAFIPIHQNALLQVRCINFIQIKVTSSSVSKHLNLLNSEIHKYYYFIMKCSQSYDYIEFINHSISNMEFLNRGS